MDGSGRFQERPRDADGRTEHEDLSELIEEILRSEEEGRALEAASPEPSLTKEPKQRWDCSGREFEASGDGYVLKRYSGQGRSVSVPGSYEGRPVTAIGEGAFKDCESLGSVEIPKSVTSIGDHAFRGCRSLGSVEIPGSVTSIGDYAFCGCESLGSVEIPGSVTSIGNSAFGKCGSLG